MFTQEEQIFEITKSKENTEISKTLNMQKTIHITSSEYQGKLLKAITQTFQKLQRNPTTVKPQRTSFEIHVKKLQNLKNC